MRTKAEGGATFTVCDKCWGKVYPKDSERKAAEEWANIVWDEGDLPEEEKSLPEVISLSKACGAMGYEAGRSSALKELEQIARWRKYPEEKPSHVGPFRLAMKRGSNQWEDHGSWDEEDASFYDIHHGENDQVTHWQMIKLPEAE
jgi:hypothetical protein